MTFTLVNGWHPGGPDQLTPLQLAQLRIAGQHFDGVDRAPELRFVDQPIPPEDLKVGIDWDDGNFATQMLSVWEVHVDGVHRFDMWVHHVDSGTMFIAGTTEVAAGRCQFQWMTPGLEADWPDAAELEAAMRVVDLA